MAKFYVVEKEINGVNYKAQFNGLSAALKALDESYIDGTSNTSIEKIADYVFTHVIVEPKGLTPDDFESLKEFQEVLAFGQGVMQGSIKPEEKKKAKAE